MRNRATIGKVKAAVARFRAAPGANGEMQVFGCASCPTKDRYDEIVDVSAFSRWTLDRFFATHPMMLWQHNPNQPIGTWQSAEVRPTGLWVRGSIGFGFDPADMVQRLVEQKIVSALSIGFLETGRGTVDSNGVYHIDRPIDLLEISLVSIPACEAARFEQDASGKLTAVQTFAPAGGPRKASATVSTVARELAGLAVAIAKRERRRSGIRQDAALARLGAAVNVLQSRIAAKGISR